MIFKDAFGRPVHFDSQGNMRYNDSKDIVE